MRQNIQLATGLITSGGVWGILAAAVAILSVFFV